VIDLAAPISNWVVLEPGKEKRLRFSNHVIVKKRITDPITKISKEVEALEFDVTMEDGAPSTRRFSVVSQKLAGDLGPYLADRRYLRYEFTIIKEAPGTVPPRLLSARPI